LGSPLAAEDVPQVLKNKAVGQAAEKLVAQQLGAEGRTILGSQVGIRTSEGLRYVDHLVQTAGGDIVAIEVKAGGAVRNVAQVLKDAALGTTGGKFTGSGGVAENLMQTLQGKYHD
jgi:hypothetical protein